MDVSIPSILLGPIPGRSDLDKYERFNKYRIPKRGSALEKSRDIRLLRIVGVIG